MDTLFSNVTIVTMDEAMHVYFDAYLGVTDGKISYLAREAPKEKTKRLVPGEGMVLMPGLINCHTHLPMSVLRGYADDVELSSWLNDYIFPHEDRLDGRSAKAAALLSIAECVRFGTTSISDMYNFCDEIAEAVAESGIKANIARGATLFGEDFDFETHPACRELVALKEKWDGYDNGRIRVEASVHGEYTSDYRLWDALSEFAINEKAGMHVHLSETKAEHEQCLERNGLTPAQVLDCHHVFDTRAIAAHIPTQGRLRYTQHTILCTAMQVQSCFVRSPGTRRYGTAVAQEQVSTETGSVGICRYTSPGDLNPQHPP